MYFPKINYSLKESMYTHKENVNISCILEPTQECPLPEQRLSPHQLPELDHVE